MKISIAFLRVAAFLGLGSLLIMPGGGPLVAQGSLEQIKAEIAKAWEARDFPRVQAVGAEFLAAAGKPDSPEHLVTLFYIGGAKTVAGRIDEAVEHFNQMLENLARFSCQTQSPQWPLMAGLLVRFLQDMPAPSRPNMQVMLVKVWETAAARGRAGGTYATMYRGFSTMIAAALAKLFWISGGELTARSFAGESLVSAPAVEIYDLPYTNQTVCGCIRIQTSREFLASSSEWSVDDYTAYARGTVHRYTHPPRAWALLAALEVLTEAGDDVRLRRAAMALEELRDRSLTTGSLNDWSVLRQQVDAQYELLKGRYSHLWPAPKVFPAMSEAAAGNDPRLGKTGPPYTQKYTNRYGGESGKKFSFDYWPILVKATLPTTKDGTPSDAPWWLYALEGGQLRIVGRAVTWSVPKKATEACDLRVERLALGNCWGVDAILDKKESEEPLKVLGPVYVSRELLGYDFQDLPPHRQILFKEGLPWIGMSTQLMRINMRACDKAIRNRTRFSGDIRDMLFVKCDGWTVTLRDGRIAEVTGHPPGTKWAKQ